MPEIYVDGDACPVKDEILKVAYRHDLVVHLVSNQWLRIPVGPKVNKVVVNDSFDAADDWIEENISEGDICITNDIPLAARCLENGAMALGATGKPFTGDNIGMALAMRELKSQLRDMGEDKGYNASFTKKDSSNFS
ncbi:MAG: YaiI/YqxD family protein, partial [Kordiimonadaceae bacterium]|nr:YaiI/YqxD family protein [Kordiimonadaceae bacterium]